MEEFDLKDIFSKANGGEPGGASNPPQNDDPDGGNIPTKSAEELEREAAAAAAASAAAAGAGNDNNPDGGTQTEPTNGDGSTDGDYDVEVMSTLFQAIVEKTGSDIKIENIKSPEELIDAIDSIIDSKAKPKYSSELSEEFDKFIREGGNPVDFLSQFENDIFLPKLETQKDKEDIVKAVLKDAGFSERQIEKKIDALIEGGLLDSEAEDALDVIRRKNADAINQTAKQRQEQEARLIEDNKKFVKSVEDYIDGLKDVRGIPITKEQKANLKKYLLVFDKEDGMTGYQRDHAKSVAPLVESAFITQNSVTLLKAAESKGSSDALSKLQSVLQAKKVSGTQGNNRSSDGGDLSLWLKQAAVLSGRRA